tara:strand:+ start:205 stop:849 length:645 start_codon:yes stop_codon:yes gene_type:complete
MSSEFGYIPESPDQSYGNNNGIFSPKDIYNLVRDDKWSESGQLELIQTQSFSSGNSALDFTAIKETEYDIHFFVYNNIVFSSGQVNKYFAMKLSNDNGSSFITTNYDYGLYYGGSSFGDVRGTGESYFTRLAYSDSGAEMSGYGYIYNAGKASKYTFATLHSALNREDSSFQYFYFGNAVHHNAEVINGFRFYEPTGTTFESGSISLYGIKVYK